LHHEDTKAQSFPWNSSWLRAFVVRGISVVSDGTHPHEEQQRQSINVVVYGTRWCAATQLVRRYLDRYNVPHIFRDLDRDSEAASQVRWWTGGFLSHPVVQIGGEVLVEPLSNDVNAALARQGLI
jgi:mycoredoxin